MEVSSGSDFQEKFSLGTATEVSIWTAAVWPVKRNILDGSSLFAASSEAFHTMRSCGSFRASQTKNDIGNLCRSLRAFG